VHDSLVHYFSSQRRPESFEKPLPSPREIPEPSILDVIARPLYVNADFTLFFTGFQDYEKC
jgi:hypothetical protein